ncbi:diguanylate cyclase domain-containing protein [Gayadomonas joobiniege]|uniref:diguanylate cyclase domain-containing protein n=1 Tax=Gayadomonas joobiniege TaxID=1234606 RepID=UPI000361CB54|nr:diguanylate cyclase [Gayadomonas joobiniege]
MTNSPLIQPSKETLIYRRSFSFLNDLSKYRDSLSLLYGFSSMLIKAKVISSATIFEVHHKHGDYIGKVADAKSLVFNEIMEMPWQVKDSKEPISSAVDSFLAHRPVSHRLEGNKREIFCFPIVPELGQVGYLLQLNVATAMPLDRFLYPHTLVIFQNMLKLCCNMERDVNTGLYNRQVFERTLVKFVKVGEILTQQAIRNALKKSLVLLNIDLLERETMPLANLVKTEVQIADALRVNFRNSDLIFRISDEEYIILLFSNQDDGCQIATERCRERLQTLKVFEQQKANLTSAHLPLLDEKNAAKVFSKLRLMVKEQIQQEDSAEAKQSPADKATDKPTPA